jgi:hypothetical protein
MSANVHTAQQFWHICSPWFNYFEAHKAYEQNEMGITCASFFTIST